MKHFVGQARNGMFVYVDLIRSKAAEHISQQPHILGLTEEALKKTALHGADISIEHDMKRTIGHDFVVTTTESDTILYAQPVKDNVYSRFVKNGKPSPTQHLALLLHRDDEGSYELLDAWIGHISPPRPGSINEAANSKSYWEKHAFVLEHHSIQQRTLTRVCPYEESPVPDPNPS